MVFSSSLFFFGFLPVFFICYTASPIKFRNAVIIIFSILFYAWGAHSFVAVALGTCVIDFLLGAAIDRAAKKNEKKPRRLYIAADVVMNLGLLAYFKYFNFFVENINIVFSGAGINPVIFTKVVLPIGISFVVFQKTTYCLDIAKGLVRPAKKFSTYIEYLFIFPQIIAGPIVKYNAVAEQLADTEQRRLNPANVKEGFYRFAAGIFKKVWIADVLAIYADIAFNGSANAIPIYYCWFGALCYMFQIYFDFSAYSDMAIGMLKIMGVSIPENFNNPYISKSITEFWKRWHISLTSWMREYLYIPLGGNRKGKTRTYINQWLVFLLSGLWHGANWTFVAWGIFHGTLLCIEKMFVLRRAEKLPPFLKIAGTLFLVIIGWILFRSDNLGEAWIYIKQMFNFESINLHPEINRLMNIDNKTIFIFILAAFLCSLPAFADSNKYRTIRQFISRRKITAAFHILIFALSALKIGTAAISPFIYFRF